MAPEVDPIFRPVPLSIEDEKLVAAYVRVGRALDELPYTPQFEEIVRAMGIAEEDMDGKHAIFKRLMNLRKQARLPRIYSFAS